MSAWLYVIIVGDLYDYGQVDTTCWLRANGTVDDVKRILNRVSGVNLCDMCIEALVENDVVGDVVGFWEGAACDESLASIVLADEITIMMRVADSDTRLNRLMRQEEVAYLDD